jgi:hypothetical protein
MAPPKKPAGKVEKAIRRVILGPAEDRKPLTDEEIRRGTEKQDGDRR